MKWATNKQFKSDSARVAFLVCSGFCVYGVVQRLFYGVPHYLTGRYVSEGENLCSSYFLWK
ncbi:hypothetical protein OFD18_24645, partial [Escherichia coli]|nr:hypothetical protein [Escherichia coli]